MHELIYSDSLSGRSGLALKEVAIFTIPTDFDVQCSGANPKFCFLFSGKGREGVGLSVRSKYPWPSFQPKKMRKKDAIATIYTLQ